MAYSIYNENAGPAHSTRGSLAKASLSSSTSLGKGQEAARKPLGVRRTALGDMTNMSRQPAKDVGSRANKQVVKVSAQSKVTSVSQRTRPSNFSPDQKEFQSKHRRVADREQHRERSTSSVLSPSSHFEKMSLCPSAHTNAEMERAKAFDIDEKDRSNPLMATEYVEDIHTFFRDLETRTSASAQYMSEQGDVNERMRAILIDWLVQVHNQFKLLPETMYLTVNILDRFLEASQVSRQRLQLVGVTALLLASKYQELYPPELRDLVYYTDKAYTGDEILEMEEEMLNALGFRITVATPFWFVCRYLKAAEGDDYMEHLAHYITERCLQEYKMLRYKSSTIAAAAVCLSRKILQKQTPWTETLQHHTRYSMDSLTPCMNDMKEFLNNSSNNLGHLCAVKKKYSSSKYLQVARMLV